MRYYLLDVKRIVSVNGVDVAFDYLNTYYFSNEAVKEAIFLSTDENVLHVSVHQWTVNEKGEHNHVEGDEGIIYRYEKCR